MNKAAVQITINEARECALAMLESGTYIERELPGVYMAEPVRAAASGLCSRLIATKDDVFHELFELDALLAAAAPDDRVASAIALLIRRLRDAICQMHELVTTLEAAAGSDPRCGISYMLVAECAVNILGPFSRAKEAADALGRTNATGDLLRRSSRRQETRMRQTDTLIFRVFSQIRD